MAMKLLSSPSSLSHHATLFSSSSNPKGPKPISVTSFLFNYHPNRHRLRRKMAVRAFVKEEEKNVKEFSGSEWGKVSAVLFDMDGVLCNSEVPSRRAAVDVFAEMGVEVTVEDFVPFTGTGEANFLGGVASIKEVEGFNTEDAKKRFFEIYLDKYAKPNSGIGFPGALELVTQCKSKGLKVAVASSADRIKVDANLASAGLPLSLFDAIVSADAFENLKPAPDIFLAVSRILNVPPSECIVIEDALAGVQAAKSAQMRCIAVKTTLSEETLKTAGPSLIRNEIGSVSLNDILSGGSDGYSMCCPDEKTQGNELLRTSAQISPTVLPGRTDNGSIQATNGGIFSIDSTPTSKLSQKTILDLLNNKCSTSLQPLTQAHAIILRTGHIRDHYVVGTLVKCYANPHFNNFDFALKVFDHVPSPNVFVWNIVIKGCLDNNEPCKAISSYYKMVGANSRPNKFTFPTLFKACTIAHAIQEGLQFHAHVVKHGLIDRHIKSAGIQMYASFGCVREARKMLEEGGESDVICWNAMVDGYLKCGDVEAAKELFECMPDKNVGSWNAMISGFAKCGMVEMARKLFNEMDKRDEISWSAIIDGYIKGGYFKEALEVFNEMQREKISPRKYVLSSVLAACTNMGALDQGRWIHAYVKRNSIRLDAVLGTALVDMYSKCGRLDMAWEVFENMNEKKVFTWNAMIGGLAMHGRAEDAIELFCKMRREKLKPNGITFVGVLNACSHSGMVDEGLEVLDLMKRVYGIEPEVEHYGCVVDLLGRAGLLAEAEDLIKSMPIEPNAAVWGALLGACRIYGNVELGERVGKVLLELEPENSGRYALLSNIYAKVGRWDDVAEVRKLMKQRGIKTTPGSSIIDLGGMVHEFKMGDGSHPEMKEIYLMVERIIERLHMEGYSPNTSQVLFDIEEEKKETALQHHSEKLAIAFGLLNTTPGMTIRIVNNLRVCEDCHSAIAVISKVYNREITVRDRVRYHHFKGGRCSCKDFW